MLPMLLLSALVGTTACAGEPASLPEHGDRLLSAAEEAAVSDAIEETAISIGKVSTGGPGCVPDSYTVDYEDHATGHPAHKNVTLHLRQHRAVLDGTSSFSDNECSLVIPIRVPPGWQYALTQVELRGTASLSAGMIGTVDFGYGFMGRQSIQLSNKKSVAGPLGASFEILETVRPTNMEDPSVWSTCGGDFRSLVINTSLYLQAPNVISAAAERDEALTKNEFQITQVGPFKLALRQCPEAVAP